MSQNQMDALQYYANQFHQNPTEYTQQQLLHYLTQIQQLLSPVNIKSDSNDVTIPRIFQLAVLTGANGQHYIPAFTTAEAAGIFRNEKTQLIPLSWVDYIQLITDQPQRYHGVVVNPFDANLPLSAQVVSMLQKGSSTVPQKNTSSGKVLLSIPAAMPQQLIKTTCDYMQKHPEFRCAYLLQMLEGTKQSYVMAIDFEGEEAPIFQALAQAIAYTLQPGELLDLVNINSNTGRFAQERTTPFYRKSV